MFVPFTASAGYLDILDPDNWNIDWLGQQILKYIVKKAKKPEDVNVMYELNYDAFSDAYRNSLATDLDNCRSKSTNPAWIDGVKNDAYIDSYGNRIFTVADGSSYVLAQRDLSRRGIERINDHWFNWYIPNGNNGKSHVIQNLNKEDPYAPYTFSKATGYKSQFLGDTIPVISSSISTDNTIGIKYTGGLDPNYTPIDAKIKPIAKSSGLVLKFCDVYRVKIIPNTKPTASIHISKRAREWDVDGYNVYISVNGEDSETQTDYLKNSIKVTFQSGRTYYGNSTVFYIDRAGDQIVSVEGISSDGGLVGKKVMNESEISSVEVEIVPDPRSGNEYEP